MFTLRPYQASDASACGECLYEGFFSCPIEAHDRMLLQDYAQVLIEKCNFAYVAEAENRQVVGFICGKYSKQFSPSLARQYETKKHYGLWYKMFFKFYLKQYRLSPAFEAQFDNFFRQLQEREAAIFGACDLELVAISSRAAYRKGLGTALLERFLDRGKADGANSVRLFTNTLASWEFYEKRGFARVAQVPFRDGSGNQSIVYERKIQAS